MPAVNRGQSGLWSRITKLHDTPGNLDRRNGGRYITKKSASSMNTHVVFQEEQDEG